MSKMSLADVNEFLDNYQLSKNDTNRWDNFDMSNATSGEIEQFLKETTWKPNEDYYKGRLKSVPLPKMTSQEDVDSYLANILSNFKRDDPDILKLPEISYRDTKKREILKQYNLDLVEKKNKLKKLMSEGIIKS